MSLPISHPDAAASDNERRFSRQLAILEEVAEAGARAPGRELCAAIFLEHGSLLHADRTGRRRFVACLLLLRMTNLLARLLGATNGIEVRSAAVITIAGERILLAFGRGEPLSVPVADLLPGQRDRPHQAALWSERVLVAAETASRAGAVQHTREAALA